MHCAGSKQNRSVDDNMQQPTDAIDAINKNKIYFYDCIKM